MSGGVAAMVMSIVGTTGSDELGAPGRDEAIGRDEPPASDETPSPGAPPAPGEAAELQPAINKSPPTTSPAVARGDNGTCPSGPWSPGNLMSSDVITGPMPGRIRRPPFCGLARRANDLISRPLVRAYRHCQELVPIVITRRSWPLAEQLQIGCGHVSCMRWLGRGEGHRSEREDARLRCPDRRRGGPADGRRDPRICRRGDAPEVTAWLGGHRRARQARRGLWPGM